MEVPADANANCVGPTSALAGKSETCAGCPNQSACASGAATAPDPVIEFVSDKLGLVKHKILVLSGKGGVGKSTFSAQLAFTLAHQGKNVGLLDVDICGPSIPRMLGLVGQEVHQSASGWSPVYVEANLGVMSIGFMLPTTDDAVIWRGPRKNGLIKQFLTDVDWGELDYLIIDTPPGTSDEHISIVQYLKSSQVDGAIIITTPQEISMADVRKELNFCKKTGIKVLGVVENMTELQIPFASFHPTQSTSHSDTTIINENGQDVTANVINRLLEVYPELLQYTIRTPLFTPSSSSSSSSTSSTNTSSSTITDNPEAMAKRFQVPYLGKLPMDPSLLKACEEGLGVVEHFPTSAIVKPLLIIVNQIIDMTTTTPAINTAFDDSNNLNQNVSSDSNETNEMIIG